MTPEGKVKIWLMDQVKKRYGHTAVWAYAPPGGAYGQAGAPDRTLLISSDDGSIDPDLIKRHGYPPGVFAGIEVKADGKGYGLTPLQEKRLREIHEAGGVAAELSGKDFVRLNEIFHEIDRRRTLIRDAWLRSVGEN